MKKSDDIRRFSVSDLAARRARGDGRTDFDRLRGKSVDDVEREIAGDPDFRDQPADWLTRAEAATHSAPSELAGIAGSKPGNDVGGVVR